MAHGELSRVEVRGSLLVVPDLVALLQPVPIRSVEYLSRAVLTKTAHVIIHVHAIIHLLLLVLVRRIHWLTTTDMSIAIVLLLKSTSVADIHLVRVCKLSLLLLLVHAQLLAREQKGGENTLPHQLGNLVDCAIERLGRRWCIRVWDPQQKVAVKRGQVDLALRPRLDVRCDQPLPRNPQSLRLLRAWHRGDLWEGIVVCLVS